MDVNRLIGAVLMAIAAALLLGRLTGLQLPLAGNNTNQAVNSPNASNAQSSGNQVPAAGFNAQNPNRSGSSSTAQQTANGTTAQNPTTTQNFTTSQNPNATTSTTTTTTTTPTSDQLDPAQTPDLSVPAAW